MAKSKRGISADTATWTRSAADKHAVKNGCWFDANAGRHVCEFFTRFLSLSKGAWAGKPFKLLKWQREQLLLPLFGWKAADGSRRYRVGYVEIPKKNGKSGICSGLSLYLAAADGEPGAEVYCAAGDREQAGIVFNESRNMVKASRALASHAKIIDSKKRIDFPATNSFIRVVSSEAYTSEGLNIHGLIFDELHVQKNRELWDALRYGGAARRQPLLLSITTAGWDTTSICYEQHEYALKVLSGEIFDDAFFPLVFAADPEDDWRAESTWRKANPSWGETINAREFAQAATEAEQSTVKLNAFKRYRLNIWTANEVRWLDPQQWAACAGEGADDPVAWRMNMLESLREEPCFAGLDLGSTSDLTAFVLLFENGILLPWFWCPESTIEKNDNVLRDQYEAWARGGVLSLTDGNVCDYDRVRADIKAISEQYRIADIAVDRLFNGYQLCSQLMADGHNVIAFGQGFVSMAAPCKMFEERVISGSFQHGNNPLLNWMAGSCSVAEDNAGNLKPVKQTKKSQHKIDGIVAAIMALGRSMVQGDSSSVYDERGILTI